MDATVLAETESLGLTGARSREDLLATRDRVVERVDYEGLLGAMGERGAGILAGIEELEAAVDDGGVGYVSLVSTVPE